MTQRYRAAIRAAGLGTAAAVALLGASAAHAGEPVAPGAIPAGLTQVNLLNINDFHGRIDDNNKGDRGLSFACTLVNTKAALGDNTLLLSAGDNIGASPFTSASQEDNPTIAYLNALGLEASAVGNHEFDRGFSDLDGRVQTNANFEYLGANVYQRGTTTPALPEYYIKTLADGTRIGVIGAVTTETPTLVSPTGVTGLDFGNAVDAVNRVADKLTDGDPSNGEADVLVAEYHEGASAGTPDGATIAQEIAAAGVFADIVTKTSVKVSAIFTGHTHKEYAWDGPMPGGDGTRPILQAASYASFIGQVSLGIDPQTKKMTHYSVTNVPVPAAPPAAGAPCTDDPAYVAAAGIVNTAVAQAKVLGSEVVGSVTTDITTAYNDGKRDNRARESTLGNLTAQVWLEALNAPGRSGADIGVMNPGSLRAELLYAPSGNEKPGEVTYAEAASIHPFANTLQTIDITGAQFKTLLEQQWQPTGASRPFLKLSLSDNVTYTYDANAAAGSRILTIMINGEPFDPAATYTVSSRSFLIAGGDNFTVLREGTNLKDSGLIDTDAFVNHLKASSPLSPTFDKQAVMVPDAPTTLTTGESVTFHVEGVDLTSLQSPANTSFEIFIGDRSVGTAAITTTHVDGLPTRDGISTVTFTVPADVTAGAAELRLVAAPTGTTVTLPVTLVAAPVEPTPEDTPAPEVTPTTPATLTPPASGTRGGGVLANTGATVFPILWVGGLLLLFGLVLVLASSSRMARRH